MSNPACRTRRAIGLTFLATAILLLCAGQTFLHDHLHGHGFALYWLLCLLFVALALLTALLDLLIVRHQARRQQLDLIKDTLGYPNPAVTPDIHPTAPDGPRSPARPVPGANH
jgi:uncharacterized membrane protein